MVISKSGFAERLAYARKLRMINQAELSKKCGHAVSSITKWEKGYWLPQGKHIRNLAKALEVNPHWLLTGEGEMYESAQDHGLTRG